MAKPRPLIALPTSSLAFIACVTIFASATRHSRHLDERSYHENRNHRPVFTNCSNYAPVINEKEPPGTEVIQVHAQYRDPRVEGGTITYSFLITFDESSKFAINSTNGMIVTSQILDRDKSATEEEVYLTVVATDNARSHLIGGQCTFKVTIIDLNDNSPVFKKPVYKEYITLLNLPVGRMVMQVFATDIDVGNNSVVRHTLTTNRPEDATYFWIDREFGEISLNRTIDRSQNYTFKLTVTATDLGENPLSAVIHVDIPVVKSHKKMPTFLPRSAEPIRLPENFSDFDASIVRLKAVSNIDNSSNSDNSYLIFELVTGRTEQTNKGNTFRLEPNKDVADIKLAQYLDYERNTRYSLIVRIENKYQLTAETVVDIEILDVNDNAPVFHDIKGGSVLENEPRGVFVMQVQAIDADGTSANNQVSYELDNFKDLFTIDPRTGNVTTLVTFDREVKNIYTVKIIATDNSPSALFKTGKHNKGQQGFQIEIADKNDNPPRFTRKVYTHSIYENANINTLVTEVKTIDFDLSTSVTYNIISGNTDNSFYILATTGMIHVNKPLDYEKIIKYNLTVRAFDGVLNNTAQVEIFIENINENWPVFGDFNKNPTIQEEKLVDDCITTVIAYDPDIKDRNDDQHIFYFIKEDLQSLIAIDKSGCMKLKKPLDRDPPNGHSVWTIIVEARYDDGAPSGLRESVTVNITLVDINDNAPFLDMPYPVIWGENKPPGKITELKAQDYDSDKNGPPFEFRIDSTADDEIRSKFDIRETNLYARVTFDRERRKSYDIPIAITDSGTPSMTGTSTLTVIIGDENDPKQHQVV